VRKWSVALVALIAVLAFAACGSDDDGGGGGGGADSASAEGKKVTFVGPIVAPVWLDAKEGFETEARKRGMEPDWSAPNAVDIPGNVQAVQSAITAGADGVAFCALDPKAYKTAFDAAKERDVPVILVDCEAEDKSDRLAYVGTIGATFGEGTARHLLEVEGDTGNVIVLQQTLDSAIANQIFEGFKKGLSAAPGWKILTRQADNSDVQRTIPQLEGLLRRYPETTYIYCIEANCPDAASTVIREGGYEGKVKIIGIDDQKPTLDGIKSGLVTFSAAQPFGKMGRLAAQYFADHFEGRDVPSSTDTGLLVIDKDNVDTYRQEAE